MLQDVFPETKLKIRMALVISDCFLLKAVMLLCPYVNHEIEEPRLLIGKTFTENHQSSNVSCF